MVFQPYGKNFPYHRSHIINSWMLLLMKTTKKQEVVVGWVLFCAVVCNVEHVESIGFL